MNQKTLIILNLAGFSPSLLQSGHCPCLAEFAGTCGPGGGYIPIKPVLPAVTLSMQATLTTGVRPAEHGIVGNGFYDRLFMEQRFWTASSRLVGSPRIWEKRPINRRPRVAALFWWNFLGASLEAYLNVAPFHLADGSTLSSCLSRPAGLYGRLESRLGPFPLHRFWGPAVSIESSAWIVEATLDVAETVKPDIVLSYIPQMDYSLQRSGPGSREACEHLSQLDQLLGPVLDRAAAGEFRIVILSEYGIAPVSSSVSLNRILKEDGFFSVRCLGRSEYPDLPASRAFAICDHQIAHIYVQDPSDKDVVAAKLESVPGVGSILDEKGKRANGLAHPRSGDLVALSEPGSWFEYSWWLRDEEAPDYAATVDIHRKIGYDPLELIADPQRKGIAQDPGRIKGSHGLADVEPLHGPLMITPLIEDCYIEHAKTVDATDVATLLMKMLDCPDRKK